MKESLSLLSRVAIIFSAHMVKEYPPPEDSLIVCVRYIRGPEVFANCCADLREQGRTFRTVWIDGAGRTSLDSDLAESNLANSLANTYGFNILDLYQEEITHDQVTVGYTENYPQLLEV